MQKIHQSSIRIQEVSIKSLSNLNKTVQLICNFYFVCCVRNLSTFSMKSILYCSFLSDFKLDKSYFYFGKGV